MDERHWWIATKIQETFQVDDTESPAALEQFLLEPTNLEVLFKFFAADGLNKLFVYGKRLDRSWMIEDLSIVPSLVNLKGINAEDFVCVYFMRPSTESEVDASYIHKSIFCGEIKNNPLHQLTSVLSQVFLPMLKSQTDWGKCNHDQQHQFISNVEKYANVLSNATNKSNATKQQMLRLPSEMVSNDVKHHRISSQVDQAVVKEYEAVVGDWIQVIEAILSDGNDERLLDTHSGPLTEVEKWKRRQRVLGGIMDQLKSKECKSVIGVLIQVKSKLIKTWKHVDIGMTDALNEAKDKVKYLEVLRRHMEQLQNESNPAIVVNIILPALVSAVRQMDSISRYYARNGYLGLLCMKICNQISNICREHVSEIIKISHVDELWNKIRIEIQNPECQAPVFKLMKRGIKRKELVYDNDGSLGGRLRACLCVQLYYRDVIRNLRDSMGATATGMHSLAQSHSSLDTISARPKMIRGGTGVLKARTYGATASTISGSDGREYGSSSYGIQLNDEETILRQIDSLCNRIRRLLDIIAALRQFTNLAKDTMGLPRPRLEDIPATDTDDKSISMRELSPSGPNLAEPPGQAHNSDQNVVKHAGNYQYYPGQKTMGTLAEEEENDSPLDDASEEGPKPKSPDIKQHYQRHHGGDDSDSDINDRIGSFGTPESPSLVQYNASAFLRKLYNSEMTKEEEGPSLSAIISDHVHNMITALNMRVTTSMLLDVQGKQNERYNEAFDMFITLGQNLDQLLAVYLSAIFAKKMKTQQGLAVLAKFGAVSQRPLMKEIITEHYSDVYAAYSNELTRIQEMYEEYKDDPVVPRDAPPAGGAIYWCRQLISHIEEPMKIFQENKTLNQSKEYHRTVKFYNKLATALVTYETLWYQQWCKSVDHALSGLRLHLLSINETSGELIVNADSKILNLIHEAKWMIRMKLDIPESAKAVLAKESQFKHYKMHLENCLKEYKEVCNKIPRPFLPLFHPHMESVLKCLQVGVNTITWDSMNIDAFLHKVRSSTQRLNTITDRVLQVVKSKINHSFDLIKNSTLFNEAEVIGKDWNVLNLKNALETQVSKATFVMHERSQTIESAVQEVISILSTSRINSADHGQGNSRTANPPITKKPTQNSQYRRTYRSGSGSTMTGSVSSLTSPQKEQKFMPDEDIVQDILSYYCKQLYSCVQITVCNSLASLARSLLVMSDGVTCSSLSRPGSSQSSSVGSYSESTVSVISHQSWTTLMEGLPEVPNKNSTLKFNINVKFRVPDIVLDPPLAEVQRVVDEVAENIVSASRGIVWWTGVSKNETFEPQILMDETVTTHRHDVASLVKSLKTKIRYYIQQMREYNFLWKDDMHNAYSYFMSKDPDVSEIRKEVENLLDIERKIASIPSQIPVGCIILCADPIKDALQGLAAAWKTQYTLVLHENAKKRLDSVVQYRNNIQNRLSANVVSLDQLNSTLSLLDEIHDMENKIDDVYLPIEKLYEKLKSYDLRLARAELHQVETLRIKWAELGKLADNLGNNLIKDRRAAFEQELDKQLKTFVVEVIQFRNAFDAQGPAVPGVRPAEAVVKLHDFQNRFTLYNAKRKTLDSVQRLFGIPPKPFSELDKTGEELKLLGMLYGLFQKFIAFDKRFRDTLWENADLHSTNTEVQGYWNECLNLPDKLKEWDAYTEMKNCMQVYLDVFPLLHRLAKKGKFKDIMIPEIRNRHWLEVMAVTSSKFQLEANLFKLGHLLDIGLLEHKQEIRKITIAASKELELEVKMRGVEEEWTEQVLTFENYKRRGPVLLVHEDSERLLEQLEDAQALLANMLTSKHIGPLREEAASWAEKLKGVSEVLDTWLETQDLWRELEAVFSEHTTAKELPQEAKRFSMVDRSYVKLMRRTYDTRNILQCCYGGEVPKGVVLRHMQEELEICFKSLTQYLDKKRAIFPRFYFLSDLVLLAVLSRPNDLESVRGYLRSIFSGIADIKSEKSSTWSDTVSSLKSFRNTPTPGALLPQHSSGSLLGNNPDTNHRLSIDETIHPRATGIRFKSGMKSLESPHFSASFVDEANELIHATAVISSDGEILQLEEEVSLYEGAEFWLQSLRESVSRTLSSSIANSLQEIEDNVNLEELVARYPSQVCRLALLYLWTRECEAGISELRWERKAIQNAGKKFSAIIGRLPQVINRGSIKGVEDNMQSICRARLEDMTAYSIYLRDLLDILCNRKIKDTNDFEWRRSIRFYSQLDSDVPEHTVSILDKDYKYGLEFYGISDSSTLMLSPSTEKAFVIMSQALNQFQGTAIVGESNSGKTETVIGLASMLGKFLYLIHCTDSTDPTSLAKILQGLATDGCWGCFDDMHFLPESGVSVLLDFSHAVFGALKSSNGEATQAFVSVIGSEGKQINVHPNTGFFLTYNPNSPHVKELRTSVRSLYRNVSIIKPDLGTILKAKCTALGLRSPKVLADRLKILYDFAHQQIPRAEGKHHEISLQPLFACLQLAVKKRQAKEEKSDARPDIQMSRSNSQSSISRAQLPIFTPSPGVAGNRNPPVFSDKVAKKTMSNPNILTSQAKIDHSLVVQSLIETISPGLTPSDAMIFHGIIRDVFCGIPSIHSIPMLNLTNVGSIHGQQVTPLKLSENLFKNRELENAVEQVAQEAGLVLHGEWVSKVIQIYNMAETRQGIVIAGPAGSGKSSMLSVLVDALCLLPSTQGGGRAVSPGMSSHKLQKINPLTVDDLSLLFGCVGPSREWIDGLLSHSWKKANRNQSTTWLCLDGPLVTSWSDYFNNALSPHKVLELSNGDRLYLTSNMRVVFETASLDNASPSMLARTGLVYVDKNVLGWRPLAKAWFETRPKNEVDVLTASFDSTLDVVCAFVFKDSRLSLPVCEVGLFSTCLALLNELLNDHQQHIGGDLHIERLYLFCLVWAFGGLLEGVVAKQFSDLLRTLSSALPDYDHEISVFDYYVDESGEWDTWAARVPEATYTGTTDMLGEVFVDTVETIRTRCLLDFTHMARKHTLIIGEHGVGKTALINDFLDTQDKQMSVLHRLVFSRASTASQLHSFMQHNIQHRQGFVYGAKDGKYLEAFIDDLNLPKADADGVQRCNELLRTFLDHQTICKLDRPFEFRIVQGLEVLATCSIDSSSTINLDPRLLRHFAVFRLRRPSTNHLQNIIYSVLEANLSDKPLSSELHESISAASCLLLESLREGLKASPLPGRQHYAFTLRHLVKACQCLRRITEEDRANDNFVISLWEHEMNRLFQDQICRSSDRKWFEESINKTMNKHFSVLLNESPTAQENGDPYFCTFQVDSKLNHRTILPQRANKIQLFKLQEPKQTLECIQAYLTHFNEEKQQLSEMITDLLLSDDILLHVIRIHRVLSYYYGGSMVLVGAVGSHLVQLTKLALHVAGMRPFKVDASRPATFFDSLRSAVRIAGTEGVPVALVLTARELYDSSFLDAINSLLVAGEYPHLFSNDEMEGLLQVLMPTLRRSYPNMMSDPMKFFISRVKCNLHIIITLPPSHFLLSESLNSYPGILSETQVIWIQDWPQDVLIQQAEFFINHHKVAQGASIKSREGLTMAIANIHSLTLRESKQTPWSGETESRISVISTSLQTKKDKESVKVEKMDKPNLPYSKILLLERIKMRHIDTATRSSNEVFVGPYSYQKFMQCLHQLYEEKSKELQLETSRLKRALETLDETRKDARTMQKAIGVLRQQYNSAQTNVQDLFKKLTMEATRLEKLKAYYGIGAGSLNAFLKQLGNTEEDDFDDDFLLREEDRDEYDDKFEEMREAHLKSKRVKIDEEIAEARQILSDARSSLATAKAQVETWRSKVDRGCIERLKAFKNPPVLVAQVLEMVMVLVGVQPWLSKTDTGSQPATRGSEIKTPSTSRHGYAEGTESRVSSGSTLKTTARNQKMGRTYRQLSRRQGNKADGTGSVDRTKWKAMQSFVNDTTRFVEMIHAVDWENGLDESVLHEVQSYIKKGKEGQEGVTGEGSLLEQGASATGFPAQQRKNTMNLITISAARYSSEDAAVLVEYVLSIVEYTLLCGPLKNAIERLNCLDIQLEEMKKAEQEEQKPPLKQDALDNDDSLYEEGDMLMSGETSIEGMNKLDVDSLQETVNNLQEQYDKAVVLKHRLRAELQTSKERLRSALNTLENLKPSEAEWRKELEESITLDQLLPNCILAAAFSTYCGAMTIDARKRMMTFYTHVCKHYELEMPHRIIYDNLKLSEFVFSHLDIQKLHVKRLATDDHALNSASILLAEKSNPTWCLICDPSAKIADWMEGYYMQQTNSAEEENSKSYNKLMIVKYSDLRSQFETCLSEGQPLLVTYCDVKALSRDKRFRQVLRRRNHFLNRKSSRFKMMVEDHEVECDPSFRLYFHTAHLPQNVPPELAAYTTLVYYQTSREAVQVELLDRFMYLEKPKLGDESRQTQIEKMKIMVSLSSFQDKLKDILAGEHRLLNDLSVTKMLADIKKNFDEAMETMVKLQNTEQAIDRAKDGFTDVAIRGAVLHAVVQSMEIISPLYHTSWQRFVSLYDDNIRQSDRSSLRVVCNQMTYNIFSARVQSIVERDRPIFALLTAMEVEDSLGNVNKGEREYAIAPDYGASLMSATGVPVTETRSQVKKIFDWLSDEQWHNLHILGMYYDWFHEAFDRMPKEGREMQWRTLSEADAPELTSKIRLPDNADEYYSPLQRLLVIRAMRPDRVVQAANEFVIRVLGKKFLRDEPPDLNAALRQSTAHVPLVVMFTNENLVALNSVCEFAASQETDVGLEIVKFAGCGTGEEKKTEAVLNNAMNNGKWLLLHNVQLNMTLLETVLAIISETKDINKNNAQQQENNESVFIHPNFRLWITSSARIDSVPSTLLHTSVKIMVDTPKAMKDNLLRVFNTQIKSDLMNSSSRPEWLPCLHNIVFLHGAILLRARFPRSTGWHEPYAFSDISIEQLKNCIACVERELKDISTGGSEVASSTNTALRTISWSGIRYLLTETIYGAYVTNVNDQTALAAMIDYWLASNAVKKEFELSKVKYRLPAVFFLNNIKHSSIIQALEGISANSLDSPEACNLHSSPEAVIGDDQYIFTRLNRIYDELPESSTLSHKLYPCPPTSLSGPPITSISSTSSHPWVVHRGVFATHTHALLKSKKEIELWEICYNAISKVPKAWTKDQVNDRVKKIGGATTFNLFLIKELALLQELLLEIRRGLNAVKIAVENLDNFGDHMSAADVDIAEALYNSKIPPQWLKKAGYNSLPETTPFMTWLADLAMRVSHFERILTLGKDKMPAFWLGAFFNPHALMSAFKQEALKNHLEKGGNVDNFVLHTEITQRDKDHLRDPPAEGFFLHGVYVLGCSWEKTTGEMQDSPPKNGPTLLPVIHVTFTTEPVKTQTVTEPSRLSDATYNCPVFVSTTSPRNPIFELDVLRDGVTSSRWALRGLTATVRPF